MLGRQKIRSHLLDSRLSSDELTDDQKDEEVRRFLEQCESDPEEDRVLFSGFPENLQWFNCPNEQGLRFETDLQGKLLVLDFFTYCCINCLHVLPDLRALESKFSPADGLVVVGVHSAKFDNEKDSANILKAILRYDIAHAVANDSQALLWHRLDIACWPTLLVVSPDSGRVLHAFVGEGHRDDLLRFVRVALSFYEARLNKSSISLALARDRLRDSSILKFPGKICVDRSGETLFVSDSGHHRVVAVDRDSGVVLFEVGSGVAGLRDGDFKTARFCAPQGLAWSEDGCLFVADTENHAIRKIDLTARKVVTVLGTGVQGNDLEGGKVGADQAISSPWDVCIGDLPGSPQGKGDGLFIAMAGTHQIWVYFLSDGPWLKKSSHHAGVSLRFAGNGAEANKNNSYPHKASFAQPSGIAKAPADPHHCLYIADSESSSVRSVSLKDGSTKGIVGGAVDPQDLFSFGDVDGKGNGAKLQHPLAVTWNESDGFLYAADSYNHKIKRIDPLKRLCSTLTGSGRAGNAVGTFEEAQFSEPGGLCTSSDGLLLYVADTNNHAIKVVNLKEKTVEELLLVKAPETCQSTDYSRLTAESTEVVVQESLVLNEKGGKRVSVHVKMPDGCHFTEGATSRWQIINGDKRLFPVSGTVGPEEKSEFVIEAEANFSFQVEGVVYYCEQSGKCHLHEFLYEIPVTYTDDTADQDHKLVINCPMVKSKLYF